MKILKSVTPKDRGKMFIMVNSPPPPTQQGGGVITQAIKKARESLFEKIIEGVPERKSVFLFSDSPNKDIILKQSEWTELKTCFENGSASTMYEARENDKILELINEAPDYKDKEKDK